MLIPHGDLGVGTVCFALTIGIISRSFLVRLLKLPYTVIVLLMGVLVGALVGYGMK